MAFNYSVKLNDPSNLGGSADAILIYDLEQALGLFSQYLTGLGTLVVNLNIVNTAVGRADAAATSNFLLGISNGLRVVEQSSQYELATGTHVAGTTSDIIVNVSPSYLTSFFDLSPNLTFDSQPAVNKYNPIDIFLHELGHGFGISGFYNQAGSLIGNTESNYDFLISKNSSGAFFTGANAEAAYGGPVPITTTSTTQNYYHFGNQQSDLHASPTTVLDPLTLDLMNGIVLFFGYNYSLSKLDLGVLKDLGYNVTSSPNLGISGHQTVFAGGSNIVFSGDGNHDTAIFHGSSAEHHLSVTSVPGTNIFTAAVTDSVANRDGNVSLSGVEFLQFTDRTIFLENSDNANIARLYSAAFDRLPDATGLAFWENIYASNIPASIKNQGYFVALAQTNDGSNTSIAGGFMQSSEFQNRYGVLSDGSFVTQLYQNVLGRGPDQAGLTFWVNQLEQAGQTREIVLVGFAESPENVAKTNAWLVTV